MSADADNTELMEQVSFLTEWVNRIATTADQTRDEHAGKLIAYQIVLGCLVQYVGKITGSGDEFVKTLKKSALESLDGPIIDSISADAPKHTIRFINEAKEQMEYFFKGF